MNIFEFLNITVIAQDSETELSDFPNSAQEVIVIRRGVLIGSWLEG